jgi:hypothetical protein
VNPRQIESLLAASADPTPCPPGGSYTYVEHQPNGTTVQFTHSCASTAYNNGFFGRGTVDALNAAMI